MLTTSMNTSKKPEQNTRGSSPSDGCCKNKLCPYICTFLSFMPVSAPGKTRGYPIDQRTSRPDNK